MNKPSPRIERGAALLDKRAPGWEDKINLRRLDLENCEKCVVGQVYGSYHLGLAKLDQGAMTAPARYGFITWGSERFSSLTYKWREFITERRKQKASA